MKYIYESDEHDGLTVTEESRGLAFMARDYLDTATAHLPHDRVRSLRDALTNWLGESNQPVTSVATLDDIHAAIRALTAVVPLSRAPQAYVPEPDAETGWVRSEVHPADPEPKAVGHPEAPAVNWSDKLFGRPDYTGLNFDYCNPCGHSWGAHVDSQGCTAQLGRHACPCDRVRGGAL